MSFSIHFYKCFEYKNSSGFKGLRNHCPQKKKDLQKFSLVLLWVGSKYSSCELLWSYKYKGPSDTSMMIILNFLFAAAVDPLHLVKKKKKTKNLSFCNLTEKVGSTTVLLSSTLSGSSWIKPTWQHNPLPHLSLKVAIKCQ